VKAFSHTVGVASGLTILWLPLATFVMPVVCATHAIADESEGQVNKVAEPSEWEVVFPDDTAAEEYARQLEYFKIEIAAVSPDGRVEYISRLTDRKPVKHVGNRGDDSRRYLGWKSGKLHAADRRLLGQAGISTNRKELTHYFPPDVQRVMEQLERAYGGRKSSEIRRTRFEIHPVEPDRYEFVVVEQDPPRE
jgi:hypothetical protein